MLGIDQWNDHNGSFLCLLFKDKCVVAPRYLVGCFLFLSLTSIKVILRKEKELSSFVDEATVELIS